MKVQPGTPVVVRIHVDDYHDTRHVSVDNEAELAEMRERLARQWEVPVERVRLDTAHGITLTIDE